MTAKKLFLSVFFVLLLALAWGFAALFRPETYSIYTDQFSDPARPPQLTDIVDALPGERAQPNIVVILADDLGYGDVGVYGGEVIETPHMDELAAQGMRFTSAYSSAPICSPSRAGLLTGRYPLRSGIIQAMQAAGDSLARRISLRAGMGMSNLGSIDMRGGPNMVNGLPPSEITIAEVLQQAGYRTAAFGKWHLGDFTEWQQFHPYQHGFDEFVGFNMSNDDWPVAFYEGEEKLLDDIGLEQQRYTALFTEEAISFIEESAGQPFFVYLSQKDPHQPFFPSERFAGTSNGGPYGDAVSEFDWSVGQITATLRRLGLEENTLVIVTSDNGPWYEGSSGGMRGRKGQSYEGGFRVPLLAWWPGKIEAGSSSDTPVMNIDFFTTFSALAGVSLPLDRKIDGRDLSALLLGKQHILQQRPLFFYHDYDVEGVRVGPWKYLASNSHYVWPNPLDKLDSVAGRMVSARDYSPAGSDVSIPTMGTWPLLYHLARDRGEAYNVAKKYPQVVAELSTILTDWKADFYANPRQIRTAKSEGNFQ
jgi:arylsulfatase A-like enzyme